MAPVLEDLRSQGVSTFRAIAAALNGRGMLTRLGGRWHVSNVRNLIGRLSGHRATEQHLIGNLKPGNQQTAIQGVAERGRD
jgi:hypothetical protein